MLSSVILAIPSKPSKSLHILLSRHSGNETPLVLLHGLGSSSSFWVTPLLTAKGRAILGSRTVIAVDFDGHGLSSWSGLDSLSMHDLLSDLKHILDELQMEKIILAGHSMSAIIISLFAAQYPNRVDKIFLLNPTRNLSLASQEAMRARAIKVLSSPADRSNLASTISSTAVSNRTASSSPTACSFIRHLVLSTRPEAYAAACIAIANAPSHISLKGIPKNVKVLVVSGDEDYMADKSALEQWIDEIGKNGNARCVVLVNVGHWGAIEEPEGVASALDELLSM